MPRKFLPLLFSPAETLRVMGCAEREAFAGPLRLLVWNMYKGYRAGWADDLRTLSRDRDLVLLQEAVLNTRFDAIFTESQELEWVMARSHGNARTDIATGVKTGTRVKSLTQSFLLSPDVEPFFKTPKMLLATLHPVADSEHPLLVVNVHAINFVSYGKFSRQVAQILLAAERHVGPVILAGDFNTWNDLRSAGLAEIVRKMDLQEVDFTRRAPLRHLGRHLDHVFYRGLTLTGAKAMTSIRSSDHTPLLAEFTL